MRLFFLFILLSVQSTALLCYFGKNAYMHNFLGLARESPSWPNETIDRLETFPFVLEENNCEANDICILAKGPMVPPSREIPFSMSSPSAWTVSCANRENCSQYKKFTLFAKVVCCETDLCNLPFPDSVETEQPLPLVAVGKKKSREERRISSSMVPALPLFLLLLGI